MAYNGILSDGGINNYRLYKSRVIRLESRVLFLYRAPENVILNDLNLLTLNLCLSCTIDTHTTADYAN